MAQCRKASITSLTVLTQPVETVSRQVVNKWVRHEYRTFKCVIARPNPQIQLILVLVSIWNHRHCPETETESKGNDH